MVIKESFLTAFITELRSDEVIEDDCFENFTDLIDIVLTRSKFNSETKERSIIA